MNKIKKTSKAKKPHSTTNPKENSKRDVLYDPSYYCTLSWRERPAPLEKIIELARDFWNFAYEHAFVMEERKPVSLTRWRVKVGLPSGTYDHWYQNYPDFRMIIDEGKEMLGMIREEGMLNRQFSEKSTMYTMHQYSRDWKSANSYHDERAKQLRLDDQQNKMLQPQMLSAEEFENILNKKDKSDKE